MAKEVIKNPPQIALAAAFDQDCLRLLMVRPNWRRLELCHYAELEFPLSELADTRRRADLKSTLREWGLSQKNQPASIRVIIPDNQALMLEIEKGILDQNHNVDAAKFLETTLFRPDEVCFDIQPLPAKPKRQILLLAKRELVDGACALFSELGLRVDCITSAQDILARLVPSHLRFKNEAILVFMTKRSLSWSAYACNKLIAASSLPLKTLDDAAPLLQLACCEALAKLGPEVKPTIYLAGPAAGSAMERLNNDANHQEQSNLSLPMCLLKREELLPPELGWEFLPLYLALKNKRHKQRSFNLAPQPKSEPIWAQSSLTQKFAIAAVVLFLILAGQVIGQVLVKNHQAKAMMAELQGNLLLTRKKIGSEEKKLKGLAPLIQASERQQRLTPALVEVIRRLPPQAWLEKYQWQYGKAVIWVAGIDNKLVKATFANTGMMSLNGTPKALKPSPSGGQRWQVTMAMNVAKPMPKPSPKKVKQPKKAAQLLDAIRPSTVQR